MPQAINFNVLGALALMDDFDELITETEGDVVYAVGTPLDYGYYQEFGSVQNPPQPYMRPARDRTANKTGEIMARHDSIDAGVEALAEDLRGNAKDLAPVDTGRLRDSINMRKVE